MAATTTLADGWNIDLIRPSILLTRRLLKKKNTLISVNAVIPTDVSKKFTRRPGETLYFKPHFFFWS